MPVAPMTGLRRRAAAAALAALVAVRATGAAEWTVDDDGPADFRTLQAAIDAFFVISGDTILVKAGTYFGNAHLDSKDLVIRSEAGPFVTTLDAQGSGSVVSLYNRSSATILEGFTITGGRDQTGGGIWIYGGAPVITRNVIRANSAIGGFLGYGYGGGIEIYSAAPVITRNVIRDNTALDGGGGIDVYYAGPSTAGTCCPVISQNTIVGNRVTTASGMGGGILSFGSSPRITSSILSGNQAPRGGGLYVFKPQGVHDAPDATGSIFFANTPDDAASSGGWNLPGSNPHADPRLGPGLGIDLWPRSDSPTLDAAEADAPDAADLTGLELPADSDLDGSVVADIGALENRSEITSLVASRDPNDRAAVILAWDGSRNPAVVFNIYAHDGDPFKTDGGVCLTSWLSVTEYRDAAPIPARQVRFYLVTGRGVSEGSRGLRSDGTARPTSPDCSGD